ncbi:MAG: enoyl-CoA hydratase, partial [Bauldia sp.]|nr:enoyl-CoA hydratase [Bauldia sp.]
MSKRHFEDFTVGEVVPLPARRISRAEIIAFATEFDPQPFHLDELAPATDLTSGLFASGWHVSAVFMRMLCEGLLLESACIGSPGIDT